MKCSWLLAAFMASSMVASGCSDDASTDDAEGIPPELVDLELDGLDEPVSEIFDLDGVMLWVGSEDSTVQRILGYLTVELLEASGAEVEGRVGLGSELLARDSLLSGEIDLYWSKIGNAWTVYLREPEVPSDVDVLHDQVAARDLEENGVVWLAPAAFTASRGMAVREAGAESLGLQTLSDMAAFIEDGDTAPVICVTSEFTTFPNDGRVEFEEVLDVELPEEGLRIYDQVPIYPDTGAGECQFGLVETTSGRILEYGLTVLEDDVGLFLLNNPAVAVREDVMEEHAELAPLFALLAGALTPEAMQELTRDVELRGIDEREAAHDWLIATGFIPDE